MSYNVDCCAVHTGMMADVAMAAAMTRSASVTDSPILTGTDAMSSPMETAGDRVGVPSHIVGSLSFSLQDKLRFCLFCFYGLFSNIQCDVVI